MVHPLYIERDAAGVEVWFTVVTGVRLVAVNMYIDCGCGQIMGLFQHLGMMTWIKNNFTLGDGLTTPSTP